MPKITMPKIEMPKMPADPLAPVKASARKVSDGTKKAWEGTKELFTFGGDKHGGAADRARGVAARPAVDVAADVRRRRRGARGPADAWPIGWLSRASE